MKEKSIIDSYDGQCSEAWNRRSLKAGVLVTQTMIRSRDKGINKPAHLGLKGL